MQTNDFAKMPQGLAVDEQNELQEYRVSSFPKQPAGIRIAATIISFIFHPVFVPVYAVAFMVYIHPYLFAGFSDWNKSVVMIQAAVMFTFFPLVTVLLLKGLHFIKSIQLRTQRDRIIPFVACGIWYFWIWNVWRHLPDYPQQGIQFALGIFIASWVGLVSNSFMKTSMHAIAMGVVTTFMFGLAYHQSAGFGVYLSLTIFFAGLVCTARFIVSDHTRKEVYVGFLFGVVSQLAAIIFG